MLFFKTKLMKLTLSLMVLALFFSFCISEVKAAGPALSAKDNCGFSITKSATVNVNSSCEITGLTGFAGGDLNVTGVNTIITIATSGKLVLDPGRWINLVPPKGQIHVETVGTDDAIIHGTLCISDGDGDGYANNNASFVVVPPDASKNKQACSVLGAGYVEKKDLVSLTEYDCADGDGARHDCCTTGYKDYDKDGDGAGAQGCYVADASYNVVANSNDCNDSSPTIKNGYSWLQPCGSGACQALRTDTCTNGSWVTTIPCPASTKLCCDANNNPKPAQTPISTCLKCDGVSADPVNQAANEDLGNKCGGLTCQEESCSGAGDYCAYKPAGTVCWASAGICDVRETCTGSSYTCPFDSKCAAGTYWNGSTCVAGYCSVGSFNTPAAGACQRSATDRTCSGSSNICDGNTTPRYQNAPSVGNIWNGSAWTAATCTLNTGYSPYTCSGQTSSRSAYGCNTSGGADSSVAQATCNTAMCSGAENDMCQSGSCINKCVQVNPSYPGDDNINGYTDAQEGVCGGGGQCTSGACCDTATGRYRNSSYVCRASAGPCDIEEKCSGSSNTCPTDALQPNGYMLSPYSAAPGSCITGGSQCNGTSTSPITVFQYASVNNQVWNGSAWAAASTSNTCRTVTSTCSGNTQINNAYYGCAVGSPTCNATAAGTATAACSGQENNMCVAGNPTCVNACIAPYYSADNNGNGFNDDQDASCGGYSQCSSGACCNTSNGSYSSAGTVCRSAAVNGCDKPEVCTGSNSSCPLPDTFCPAGQIWNGTSCVAGACSMGSCAGSNRSGTNGSCSYSYYHLRCDGNSGTCGSGNPMFGGSCNCPAGTTWNDSTKTCTSNYCGTTPYYCYSGSQYANNYLNCDGSGSCSGSTYTIASGPYSCSTYYPGYPYCSGSGSCVQCTVRGHCPSDTWVGTASCSGTNVVQTWRTYSCSSNSCTYYDTSNTVKSNCGSSSQICSGGACVSCSAGTYYNSGSCSSCPPGQYCTGGTASPQSCSSGTYSSGGASSCTSCSAGSYNQSTGQTSCSQCPANYYCTGGSSLQACSSGYTSSAGSSSCTQLTCGSGYYVSGNSCTACSAGTYKSGTNTATSCATCPAGSYSDLTGQSSCITCQAGYYCTGGAHRQGCADGMVSAAGSSSCYTCPAGSYAYVDRTRCATCPANYYCLGGSNVTACTAPNTASPAGSDHWFDCYRPGS